MGDGVHNDYPAIVAALAALPPAGGEVRLPPGIFNIGANTLSVSSWQHLRGAGWGATEILYTGTGIAVDIAAGVGYARLSHLTVHCPNANATTVAVHIGSNSVAGFTQHNRVDHCRLLADAKVAGSVGVLVEAANGGQTYWNEIEGNIIQNFSQSVTLASVPAGAEVTTTFIIGNKLSNGDTMLNVVNAAECLIHHNQVDNFANGTGCFLQKGDVHVLFGNRFEGGTNSRSLIIAAGVVNAFFIGLDNCPLAPTNNGTHCTVLTNNVHSFDPNTLVFVGGIGAEDNNHSHAHNHGSHSHSHAHNHQHQHGLTTATHLTSSEDGTVGFHQHLYNDTVSIDNTGTPTTAGDATGATPATDAATQNVNHTHHGR